VKGGPRRKSDQLDTLAVKTERFTGTKADATDKYSRQSGETSTRQRKRPSKAGQKESNVQAFSVREFFAAFPNVPDARYGSP
jgi:hypothetical protein